MYLADVIRNKMLFSPSMHFKFDQIPNTRTTFVPHPERLDDYLVNVEVLYCGIKTRVQIIQQDNNLQD